MWVTSCVHDLHLRQPFFLSLSSQAPVTCHLLIFSPTNKVSIWFSPAITSACNYIPCCGCMWEIVSICIQKLKNDECFLAEVNRPIRILTCVHSISENQSLAVMPPWSNKWLLGAMALSMSLHFVILEVDFLSVSDTWHVSSLIVLQKLEQWKQMHRHVCNYK